ncbi:MAG TPA: hypothetical protein VF989_13160 [Polyangiaceae bacterium]
MKRPVDRKRAATELFGRSLLALARAPTAGAERRPNVREIPSNVRRLPAPAQGPLRR